jgi:hypothetical protein
MIYDEVLELFEESQDTYTRAVVRDAIRAGLSVHAVDTGANIKSARRKAYNRAFATKVAHENIRARLLAGERPKTGGRGRPPIRWWRMANELGIDIGQPKEHT